MVGDRSSLSLAGDAWSAAAPGGVAGERESEAERETRECESEGWRESEGRVLISGAQARESPPFCSNFLFLFFLFQTNIIQLIPVPMLVNG